MLVPRYWKKLPQKVITRTPMVDGNGTCCVNGVRFFGCAICITDGVAGEKFLVSHRPAAMENRRKLPNMSYCYLNEIRFVSRFAFCYSNLTDL